MSRARDKANSTVSNFASTGIDDNADANAITIDSSENVMIGTTNTLPAINNVEGISLAAQYGGRLEVSRDGNEAVAINRKSNHGSFVSLKKDGTTVGSIGIQSSGFYIDGESGHEGMRFANGSITPRENGSDSDGTSDLGASNNRFKDLYLSGGAYIGGTAAANQLDDYEYGVFDPDLTCSGTNYSSRTIGSRGGYYEKVGNAVFTYIYLDLSAFTLGSGSGNMKISGLPFSASTARAGSGGGGGVSFHGVNVGSTVYNVMPYASGSEVIFLTSRDQASWTAVQIGDIHSGTIFGVWFQLNYYVD